MKELHMIVDLQFGSCGKGLLAGYMAETMAPDTLICAWSPNSGHTYIDANGRKMMNTVLPNGIVSPRAKRVLLGPGSVIDMDRLWQELNFYDDEITKGDIQIMIHENAAVVTEAHREAERKYAFGIGSTMKGVGEAVIEKIRRRPESQIVARDVLVGTPLEGLVVPASVYNDAIDAAEFAIIEGSQGFSLSMNQGFYPYTTSRDCTTHQLLSDCAIPRGAFNIKVHGVARTYPIRVANRHDKDGNQIGWSGPCYDDQNEITWGQLGIEPELTTVTKLPRRVFTWSHLQIAEAIRMNGVDDVFLNFANYIERDDDPCRMRMDHYMHSVKTAGSHIGAMGWGPTANDIRVLL